MNSSVSPLSSNPNMSAPQPPQPGWTTPAKVGRVIDGDTVEVSVTRKIRVRLLDCWAPESRTRDLAEKARGLESKRRLGELIDRAAGEVILQVPTGQDQELAEVFTFGRVLGRLWLPDGREVSATMVAEGLATKKK